MTIRRTNGFTLMEVMVAMAILAIALVSIFQLQSQSISMAADSRFMTVASMLAQSKMVEAETASSLSNKSDTGDFGTDYPQYTWKMDVSDTQLPQFKKIEVTVTNNLMISRGTYKITFYKRQGM